jgi:putative transposase
MVSKDHSLSVRRQCGLLSIAREGLARSNLYYQPKGESAGNLRFTGLIDKQFLDTPWYGSRQPLGTLLRNTLSAVDNRMIERLWHSLKYECIYLNAFETGSETRKGISKWLAYYNAERPHSSHGILTPDEAYERNQNQRDWQPE